MPERSVRRVAVLAYHCSPLLEPGSGDAGGMTVYVRRVAAALARCGVATDIFTRAAGPGSPVSRIGPGVRVVSVPAGPLDPLPKHELTRFIDRFVAGVRAFAIGEHAAYDVVHSHYWQSGLAGVALASAFGVPLVHSHHSLARVKNASLAPGDAPEPDSRIDGEERVIAAADVLIASTDAEFEQLACLYGAQHDRIKTIHPGVDHATFYPGDRTRARAALGLGDGPVLLYVGRIQPLKGLELAVRATAALRARLGTPVTLVVAGGPSGDGGEREVRRLRALGEQLGLGRDLRLVGPQPHERLPLYYRAADVLTVCSHSESFGLTALEAQACGTPVVGTAVGGLSYIVADGVSGYLVDSRNPELFARHIEAIVADPGVAERMRTEATRRARPFSWERTAMAFHELYGCLLNEGVPAFCTC